MRITAGRILGNGLYNVVIEFDRTRDIYRVSFGLTDQQIAEYRDKIPFLNDLANRFRQQNGFYFQRNIEMIDLQTFRQSPIFQEFSDFYRREGSGINLPETYFISQSPGLLFPLTKEDMQNLTRPMFRNIILSLNELHKQGFVHGDIHPGNIMKTQNGDYVLTDWDTATNIRDKSADEQRILIQKDMDSLNDIFAERGKPLRRSRGSHARDDDDEDMPVPKIGRVRKFDLE